MAGGLKKVTPLRAIKFKCVDCCCGNRSEVRQCKTDMCPLWPFRPGGRVKGKAYEEWFDKFEKYAREYGLLRANEGIEGDGDDDAVEEPVVPFEE